jgi:hypothetical protein
MRMSTKNSPVVFAHPSCHTVVTVSMSTEQYPWEFSVRSAPGNRKRGAECVVMKSVPCFRQLAADMSPRRPGFDYSPVHVRFVANKVAMSRVFLRLRQFFPNDIIPSMIHTHLTCPLPEGQTGWTSEPSKKQRSFRKRGPLDRKELSRF